MIGTVNIVGQFFYRDSKILASLKDKGGEGRPSATAKSIVLKADT